MQTHFSKLALFAALLGIVVVGLGAYTRLMDAGLGCPDWPGCYGQYIGVLHTPTQLAHAASAFPKAAPVVAQKAWPEVIHRYFAGSLGALIIALFALGLRFRASLHPSSLKLTSALMFLLFGQALLGMWTVTMLLLPLVVMSHLVGGMIITTLLWCLYLKNQADWLPRDAHTLRPWVLLGAALLLMQIILGGWTSTNYAALICTDFPTCLNAWLPKMDFLSGFNFLSPVGINYEGGVLQTSARVAIQVTHRLGALVICLYFTTLIVGLLRRAPSQRPITWALISALTLQIALGIMNVHYLLPLPIAVGHNMVALGCLMTLAALYVSMSPWPTFKRT